MNKFGLLGTDQSATDEPVAFSDKLAGFQKTATRHTIDLAASDAAAAQHGFVSRESLSSPEVTARRRRAIPAEPTRHLAIRLSTSAYNRFVAYADRHQLTYHDALSRLMDHSND